MLRIDTETVGYTGPIVLIQYQSGDEEIKLHYVWDVPVQETIDLIENLVKGDGVNLYNISFDSFHLAKMYNIFLKVKDKTIPPQVWEIFDLEKVYHLDAVCLRPKFCLDSFILIKRRQLQFLLRRRQAFKIMKVPKSAVQHLHPILTEFTKELHPLLFAKFFNRTRSEYWQVEETKEENFVNLLLTFYPALGLKPIMKHMFNQKTSSIEIPKQYQPEDEKNQEYRPYNLTWPKYIEYHRSYWKTEQGIRYAKDDIRFLVILEDYLREKDQWPEIDIDSDLSWMVGQVRAKGFAIDEKLLEEIIDEISEKKEAVPTSPQQAIRYISSKATPEQRILLKDTNKNTLQAIAAAYPEEEFGQRAQAVINQRQLDKQLDLLYKFQEVGRFHPDFDVSGTKSNRMSGRGGLNAHGINRNPKIRKIFLFAEEDEVLSGGDFNAQEVTILDAVIQDPLLREQLKAGISIHQLMWGLIHNRPPEECDKDGEDKDTYSKAKNGVFCLFYGGEAPKFAETVDCSIERAEEILALWNDTYQKFADYRKETENKFASMRQPRGLGTSVEWYPPRPYEESLFGYRRYFSLENKVVEFFFGLANDLPVELKRIANTVYRRNRPQGVAGATQSALYAAAFNVQAKNLRAAGNHKIQSTGAEITKLLQAAIWNLQPIGVAPFLVQPFNVHDEIMCVNRNPTLVANRVTETINVLKKQVPLLSITWKEKLDDWSQK